VTITPTYSGCPATHAIEQSIREALDAAGYRSVRIDTVLAPAWTTDWITPEGAAKLRAYGIAPPSPSGEVRCPQCGSAQVEEVSRFGSTPCKSHIAAVTAWSRSTASSAIDATSPLRSDEEVDRSAAPSGGGATSP
jgi:phenylacetate-CoA oxygenase PaaJ subunit